MDDISVLLVNDQELFVRSLQIVLDSRMDDAKVIAIAHNGQQAVDFVRKNSIDVILMDVRMPTMDGVEATRTILKEYPHIKIVMLTTFEDDEYVYDALKHGAVGYLLKSTPPDELFSSIRAVSAGAVLISPIIADKLLNHVSTRQDGDSILDSTDIIQRIQSISHREMMVIKLISQAYTNRQISQKMGIAEQTVKNYTSSIYSKLGVTKRIEMMNYLKNIDLDDY